MFDGILLKEIFMDKPNFALQPEVYRLSGQQSINFYA